MLREPFRVREEDGWGNVETVGGVGVGGSFSFVDAKCFGFEVGAFLGVGEEEDEDVVDGAVGGELIAHGENLGERGREGGHHRSRCREECRWAV